MVGDIAVLPDLDIAKSRTCILLLAIIVLDVQAALARGSDEPIEMGYVGSMRAIGLPLVT